MPCIIPVFLSVSSFSKICLVFLNVSPNCLSFHLNIKIIKPFSQLHFQMDLLPAGAMAARFQIGLQKSPSISNLQNKSLPGTFYCGPGVRGQGTSFVQGYQNHFWPPSKVLFGLRSTSLVRKLTSILILRKKLLNKSFLLIP